MNDLIKADVTAKTVTSINARSGATTLRLKTAKEFKTEHKAAFPNASAKETKLAFESYTRTESSKLANSFDFQKAIKLAAEGKLGIRRVTNNKDESAATVVFLDLSKNGDGELVKTKLDAMSADELKTIMEYLSSKIS